MNSTTCSECSKSFSSRFSLTRHQRTLHGSLEEKHPGPDSQYPLTFKEQEPNSFTFQHPCSIVLTGPSGSGKTVLVKKILVDQRIQPQPQRIIWCYGQYQPLYDQIQKLLPEVEFVKGIPDCIENDAYLDITIRNCVILDDLMGDAKKDERVANMFTKGRHHRNVSVIYLTQNLFPQGNACRDIALNTQYMVLFNNPIDRQQVMTLARRIYPTNAHTFMKEYQLAISKPYGHLLVDLCANTPEQGRLKQNILNGTPELANVIRPADTRAFERPSLLDRQSSCTSSDCSSEDLAMPSCNHCGIMFGEWSALQQHVKDWCIGLKRKMEDEDVEVNSPQKKQEREDIQKNKLEDTNKDLYFPWTKPHVKAKWLDVVKEQEDEMGSENRAINSMLPDIQKTTRHTLADFLVDIAKMKHDILFKTLMTTAESLVKNNNLDMESAIRQAVKMYKHQINELFMPPREESDSDESEDELDNENDDYESEIED